MTFARILREPLLHFLLIGGALFAGERCLRRDAPKTTEAPRVAKPIVVNDEVRRFLESEHTQSYGRAPTAAEMDVAIAKWIDEEILYREGLARGLEVDDPRIHQRIAQKMTFVLEQGLVVPPPTEAELASWFAAHPDRWAKTELVDFTQVFVQGDDVKSGERANQLLAELQKGADPAGMGDTFSGGRRYRRRKIADLGESFGPDFIQGMEEQAKKNDGSWGRRHSRFGFHLVRIDRLTPADKPELSAVRAEVEAEYLREKRAELLKAAVADLRKRWSIER